MKTTIKFALLGCWIGCGDGLSVPDAADPPDAQGTPDAALEPDATPFVVPAPTDLGISATGPDQLHAVVAAPGGGWYVAGFAADTFDGAKIVRVGKLTTTGPDAAFGSGGYVTTGLTFVGGLDEIDLVVQPSGHLVVSATIASDADPLDTDVGLVRLTSAGGVDPNFGMGGLARLDFGTVAGGGAAADKPRALAVDAKGRIYVHAVSLRPGGTDSDFTVARLSGTTGSLDPSFDTDGVFRLDLVGGDPAMSLAATPRGIAVLADGSIVAGGYTTSPAFTTGPQPVLYKLTDAGALVPGFAGGGVYFDQVLGIQTEVYGFSIAGNAITTAGYGRDTGDQNDWTLLRFDLDDGDRSTTFGGTANGVVQLDPSGLLVGDACRNVVGLPGGKTLFVGSVGPNNMPSQDAAFVVLTADGQLDPAFGDGVHVLPFGAGAGGNDALWSAAVSGDHVLMVGFQGSGASQTAEANDDSYGLLLPLP